MDAGEGEGNQWGVQGYEGTAPKPARSTAAPAADNDKDTPTPTPASTPMLSLRDEDWKIPVAKCLKEAREIGGVLFTPAAAYKEATTTDTDSNEGKPYVVVTTFQPKKTEGEATQLKGVPVLSDGRVKHRDLFLTGVGRGVEGCWAAVHG
eukprot:TRINITY_DN1528_c0_g2_i1.p1 TRINITY_DN1528_c0_g2~~TRINITY_DN1528_c0_g2_i1.p1  ORF type:complete len:150 (+),score=35.18 TRINITY_DN1528_c0_g2_i1:648-1097(+)